MLHETRLIDRHINYHKGRIKRAAFDVQGWRQLLNPNMLLNPDPNNPALKEFNNARLRLAQLEDDYEKYMDSIPKASGNRYQRIVDTTVINYMHPPDERQGKRARSSTPMSSIDITDIAASTDDNGNNVDDEEEGIADHYTNSPPT
ncbi:hypothetical protein IV203_031231 [Nitzschia inconspicua]|uniref:Uncharacterized protein n=1 Tax=Nitzschia inconspicua TaxID=303405 RepID=A0A9K3Q2G8_9STRA|nr:hypothetical protein IV203_031231 [Nitzschia inconspicua]